MGKCNCHEKTFWSRRDFLFQSGGGLAGVALAQLLDREGLLAAEQQVLGPCDELVPGNPFAPRAPHFAPRATAVISLFMSGGVSHVDTFDPKPALTRYAGQPLDSHVDGNIVVRQGYPGPLMPSPFSFDPIRRERDRGIRDLSPHREARGRDRLPTLGVRAVERSRPGDVRDADRPDPHGLSECGLVGDVRSRVGEARACPRSS